MGRGPGNCYILKSSGVSDGFLINPIDPGDLSSNMLYFTRISQNSLKISPKFRATIDIQSFTNAHIFIKTKSFLLHFTGYFSGFNLIYWTPVSGQY